MAMPVPTQAIDVMSWHWWHWLIWWIHLIIGLDRTSL